MERVVQAAAMITLGLAAALLAPGATLAQVPPNIAAQNRALGDKIDVPAAIRTYGPIEQQPPYKQARITRDLVYGSDPRHRLDVFAPRARSAALVPVVIFATGGDFTRKIDLPGGTPFYDNVVLWAAKHGLVGVNTDRRYFRGNPWQTGPQDMAAMIGWVHNHISEYGGDPRRVIFLGHAYGGTQLVSYLAHPEFWCCSGPGITAAAIISAPLNLSPVTTLNNARPNPTAAPAATAAAPAGGANRGGPNSLFDPAHSDLQGLRNISIPVLVGSAQFEGQAQKQAATVLRTQLCAAGHCPVFDTFENHNHLSVMFSFNTADQSVSGALLNWMHGLGD